MNTELKQDISPAGRLIKFWNSPQEYTIPESVLERAKLCLLDALGCGLFGSHQLSGSIMRRVLISDHAHGASTLLGSGITVTPTQAALGNGAAIHDYELDDLLPGSMIHPGCVIVPAVLAVAEDANVSGDILLRGIVAGYEIMSRLSLAIGVSASHRGFHKTSVVGPVAATIAAGIVNNLSLEQLVNAAGLACSSASGIKSFAGGSGGGMVKGIHAGRAAEAGVLMARLAQNGFTGPRTAVDGKYGLLEVFAGTHAEPSKLWSGLGEIWAIDDLWIKVFPVCGWIQGVMQLLLELRGTNALSLQSINKVVVGTSAFAVKNNSNKTPTDTMEAQYSIPYCVTVALIDDPRNPIQFLRSAFEDPLRRAFSQRVEVVVDKVSEAAFPKHFGSRVQIFFANGKVKEASTLNPHGTAGDPCSSDEVISKFKRFVSLSSVEIDASAVANTILNMDGSTPIGNLSKKLRPELT